MKRSLLVGFLVCMFLLAFNTSVFAKNGPHQGPGFVSDTDACAGCHRTHTGTAVKLLKSGTSRYEFCISCHNGSGANANVSTGIFEGDADITYESHNSRTDGEALKGLNGGGFTGAVPYTGRSGRGGSSILLSGDLQRHDIVGADGVTKQAFGGGSTGPSQAIADFTCTSCHDPHGTKNSDNSERYRILKGSSASPVNSLVTADIKSNEAVGTHDYTKDQYKEGMADFCISCHTQYKTGMQLFGGLPNPSPAYNAGDGNGSVARFRHAIDVTLGTNGDKPGIKGNGTSVWANMNSNVQLPVEQPLGYSATTGSTDEITCLTCHQSHGTSATMTAIAQQVLPANSSTLLRLNNRGVCQDCHNK